MLIYALLWQLYLQSEMVQLYRGVRFTKPAATHTE